MRLGNSNGNNKGKKYIRKDEIDKVFALQAENFNRWMAKEYSSIVLFLKDKEAYDQDVFSETYEKVYEQILFASIKGNEFRKYFQRAYYTNLINSKVKNNRFCELLPIHERDDVDNEYFDELEAKRNKLESDILDYVYSSYSLRDFELFKMYMSLKPAVNYATLSKMTGVKTHNIQRIICKIKKDVKFNKEFSKRRKEVL